MGSTLQITFQTQALDFSPLTRGQINIVYNNGSALTLTSRLTTGTATTGYFKEAAWVNGSSGEDDLQASNFTAAFNRDFRNVGRPPGTGLSTYSNLNATVSGNVVTITSETGIFDSFTYTGNVLIVGEVITNGTVATPKVMTVARQATGDCSNVDYTITASGGTAPYSIKKDNVQIHSSWNGTSYGFNMSRGIVHSVQVLDSLGVEIGVDSVITPRNLVASEFKIRTIEKVGGSDITIENTNPVTGTGPIEYSLDGGAYQTSASFPGILEGTYPLNIKDVYGCVVSKTIEVRALQDTTEENKIRYFLVSDFNSVSFSKCEHFGSAIKKNYQNTLSGNELSGINYQSEHQFIESDIIATQFKSSYPFHVITLRRKDGTKKNLAPLMVQENLGSAEKVDCKIFPSDSFTGVYFDGGNEYEPYTTTIKGASPHTLNLPDWAVVGQTVSLGSAGEKEIVAIDYDDVLDRFFFKVDGRIYGSSDDTVQVVYNRQNYNLFQFYTYMTDVTDRAIITIEAGFSFDEMELTYVSEPIQKIQDTDKHLLIQWTGYKNLGDMVFTNTAYNGIMRILGKFRSFSKGDAETFDGDDRSYSLKQSAGIGKRVNIDTLSPKLWHKLNLVSGISGNGVFRVNNIELTRTKPMDQDELGETNFSNISIEFSVGGDGLSVQQDEIVLNPSTGVIGGGGTGKEGITNVYWDNQYRLASEDGKMISLSGDYLVFTT